MLQIAKSKKFRRNNRVKAVARVFAINISKTGGVKDESALYRSHGKGEGTICRGTAFVTGVIQGGVQVSAWGRYTDGYFFLPYPNFIEKGNGPYLYDVDGHKLLISRTIIPLIHGHGHRPTVEAVQKQISLGQRIYSAV